MLLFVFGGVGGLINASYNLNLLVHNTAWIPGHLHLTVGTAVTLSFMGITYWLVPVLRGRALWSRRLALFQAWGIGVGLQGSGNLVLEPGPFFLISTTITLVGGTMFLLWLGEQITSRGIGNGTSMIIFAGIIAEFPAQLAQTLELGRQGAISTGLLLLVLVMAVCVIAFVVFVERAQRRLLINYPKRQVGNRMYEGQTSFLPLKLNTAGVIPPIFASSLLLLPTTIASFSQASGGTGFLATLATYLAHGRPLFMILYAALIIFFCFFYTAIVFNPVETADNLKKHGGFMPGRLWRQ